MAWAKIATSALLREQRSAGLGGAPRAIETPARDLNPWRWNSRKEDMKVAIDTKIHCELTVSASLLETARIASVRRVRHFERFSLFIQTTYTACRPDHASVGHNRRTALWGNYDADPVEICRVLADGNNSTASAFVYLDQMIGRRRDTARKLENQCC